MLNPIALINARIQEIIAAKEQINLQMPKTVGVVREIAQATITDADIRIDELIMLRDKLVEKLIKPVHQPLGNIERNFREDEINQIVEDEEDFFEGY